MRNSLPLLTDLLPYLESETLMPSGAELARILVRIAGHEIEEGGPYAPERGRGSQDADAGLNIVIALFLRRLDVRLPKLDAYIEQEFLSGTSSRFFEADALAALITKYRASEASHRRTAGTGNNDQPAWTPEELAVLTKIRRKMKWRLIPLPGDFRDAATHVVERTIRGNPDKQMSLMPLYLRQALGRKGRRLSDNLLAELGLANIFFWAAFIIYDDFWDEDEAAEPRNLPIANLFAREYTSFFSTHAPHLGLGVLFHQLMDKLDAANAWEIMRCRLSRDAGRLLLPHELPKYGAFDIKFYPAAGHVIGPISMLLELGYGIDSAEVEGLTEYFKHYLIAMQLNDDAHDWKEDLGRGHISTAIALLLEAWGSAHPESGSIDLQEDMPELERLFWFETLPQLCEAILSRTNRAQQTLDSLSFVENPAPLQQFIERNRRAAEKALGEQHQSKVFLDGIQSGTGVQE